MVKPAWNRAAEGQLTDYFDNPRLNLRPVYTLPVRTARIRPPYNPRSTFYVIYDVIL